MAPRFDAMPVLAKAADRTPADHFAAFEVVYINHLISDSLMAARALHDTGARLHLVGVPYGRVDTTERQAVIAGFEELGPTWIPDVSVPRSFADRLKRDVRAALLAAGADAPDRPILVVEDGGYAVPQLHDDPTLADVARRCVGAVEHTTRGRLNDEFLEVDGIPNTPRPLAFPVVTIAGSRLKSLHEPAFVGQAIIDELTYLLRRRHQFLRHRTVALLGYGRVGKGVAAALASQGAVVTVIEPDHALASAAATSPYGFAVDHELRPSLLAKVDLVVGTTGFPSFTGANVASFLAHAPPGSELLLASGSSKQIELLDAMTALDATPDAVRSHDPDFGTWWDVDDRRITAVADGYPVIFFPGRTHGAPNRAMDPVMTQLYLAACLLAANTARLTNEVHHLDDLAARPDLHRTDALNELLDDVSMLEAWCALTGVDGPRYLAQLGLARA